ncbi:phosphonoacetaldehyde hydrolase [Chakrabartyella piscis]|uniref:phosphonoacetaldehyde hydrolase n=1 Tax=Chakrabartyella piscis TaxID=2918914 RepID=UPI0029583579|nr:phosphonoacetaldehyde hydrolase [Chakrabartyella piscis]
MEQNKRKIEMVVFDWAGTMVDYGSQAPITVFARTFAKKGVELTKEEINEPMGMEKKCHIRELLKMERVAAVWKEKQGADWTEDDVQELYEIFENDLYQVVLDYTVPIDGVVETLAKLKEMGIKIGSTTGYTSAMMERVIIQADEQGISPATVITPDQVEGVSRPEPDMLFACMKALDVESATSVIKVGDTQMDIWEGKNAGAITVGLLTGSNIMGISKAEYATLTPEEVEARKAKTREKYEEVGTDFVIDNMTELLDVIAKLNQ